MQDAKTYLNLVRERGKKGLPLERVYRQLFNRELYLMAYGKIYRNKGAMTPGTTEETADGMSLAKIDTIILSLRQERYRWTPVRRLYIEKKRSTKKRPLGLPIWSDKLVQEVIRLILESYFEPQFSDHSHGFRPQRGCHTALKDIREVWTGTTWFIEGDIKGCFDNIDHDILLSNLAQKIHDGRFIRLIKGALHAGYLEDWNYHVTYSGSPQGGIISPLLSNIYLHMLDAFVETVLIPEYTKGTRRKAHPIYNALVTSKIPRLKKNGLIQEAEEVMKQAQKLPSIDPKDPEYRRLRYIRYADDFLLGFIGSKEEAEAIKHKLREFLREHLKLELSEPKTLITHARTQTARFLGYSISTFQRDDAREGQRRIYQGRRRINGKIRIALPTDVLREKCREYMQNGKPVHRRSMMQDSPFSIIAHYQAEYRGIVEYYRIADNLYRLHSLKWIMEQSLTKTLASKLKLSVKQVYAKYRTLLQMDGRVTYGLQIIIERGSEKKPLIAQWGGISLKKQKEAPLKDQKVRHWTGRSDLEKRLLADTCELCGSHQQIEVHHIRALKDLNQYGRRDKPAWAKVMASRQRKTLMLCHECHGKIHSGKPTPRMK